jgi:hypothetical protein
MRTYHSMSHRALGGGSIEIEGPWDRVRWMALALLALLPLCARSPPGLGIVAAAAVALYLFPARRRVVFDAGRRALRIEHAGFFREPGTTEIPFDDLRDVVFQPAGRRGGRPVFAAHARTRSGRVYLFSHAGERDAAALDRAVRGLLGEG